MTIIVTRQNRPETIKLKHFFNKPLGWGGIYCRMGREVDLSLRILGIDFSTGNAAAS